MSLRIRNVDFCFQLIRLRALKFQISNFEAFFVAVVGFKIVFAQCCLYGISQIKRIRKFGFRQPNSPLSLNLNKSLTPKSMHHSLLCLLNI